LRPPNEIPAGLRRRLADEGAEVAASRPIDHGTQYDLVRDGETAKLNVYRTGKVSTGGKASRLMEVLEGWRTGAGKVVGEGSRSPDEKQARRSDRDPAARIDEPARATFSVPGGGRACA
jgi:hypothetical protein